MINNRGWILLLGMISNRHRCWCGNSSDYDKHGSSSRCTSPCAGEPTTSCGGKFAMTVSDTAGYVPLPPTPAPTGAPTSPTPANTIGCFKDHRLNRIMTSKAFSSSDMTNEVGRAEHFLFRSNGWVFSAKHCIFCSCALVSILSLIP